MIGRLARGVVAGAAGSAALNIATYFDMLLRGRQSSSVPADTAQGLAENVGLELSGASEQETSSRRSAAGALLGYVAGLGIGAVYASIEGAGVALPFPVAAVVVGGGAMAASDLPATATGATDPRRWNAAAWLSDIVPHLAYGIVTVAVLRAFRRP